MKINQLIFGAGELSVKAIPVVMVPVYIRIFGLDGYGEIGLLTAYISVFIPIVGLCLNQAIIRKLHQRKGVKGLVIVSCFSALLIAISLFTLIKILQSKIDIGIEFAGYSVGLSFLSFIFLICKDFLIHSKRRMLYVVLIFWHSASSHFFTILGAYLLDYEIEVWLARFTGEMLAYLTAISIFLVLQNNYSQLSVKCGDIRSGLGHYKSEVQKTIPIIPRSLLNWIKIVSDRNYLVLTSGLASTGILSAYTNLASVALLPVSSALAYMAPTLVEFYKERRFSSLAQNYVYCFMYLILVSSVWLLGGYELTRFIDQELASDQKIFPVLMLGNFLMLIAQSIFILPYLSKGLVSKGVWVIILIFCYPIGYVVFSPRGIEFVAIYSLFGSGLYFLIAMIFFIISTRQKSK